MTSAKPPSDPEELKRRIAQVADLASNPAMLKALSEIQKANPDSRIEVAQRVANSEALAKQGLNVPADFRIALREFEEPATPSSGPTEPGPVSDPVTVPSVAAGGARFKETILQPGKPKGDTAITVCGSIGYIACVSVGGNT